MPVQVGDPASARLLPSMLTRADYTGERLASEVESGCLPLVEHRASCQGVRINA